MNDRIKNLAEQAGFRSGVTVSDGQGNHVITKIEESVNKFAELILTECYDYIKNEAERLYALNHDDGDLLAEKCYDIMEGLKDHFDDPHPPQRDCDCSTCEKSFDPTEIPDWKFYGKKL
jgi:hypothetical protein